ncbi:MAG: hypothetical protein A2W00_04685 [Candidatus Eisenbacteria bacterium RBG_16_71_46]|nr:MAG: hypothetical protein A2W00_04685 [Candidatus Eisenbacteria bacterium RBG_16_71_46]
MRPVESFLFPLPSSLFPERKDGPPDDPNAQLIALIEAGGASVLDFLGADAAGSMSVSEFGDFMRTLLSEAHAQAAYLGRSLAGSAAAFGEADLLFGASVMAEQESYLASFLADIESGKYTLEDGTLNLARIGRRAEMYVDRLLGTANEAWVRTLPPETVLWWKLSVVDHCADCPVLADGSPYTAATVPGFPGDASTACRTNCKCWLERETGETGFKLPQEESG